MKSSLALLLLAISTPTWRTANPGYKYEFPRDHFNHPEFRTEWWYYTGNLRSSDGHRFGFELTFFRHAAQPQLPANANVWDIRDAWMAHLAVSDIDGRHYYHAERLNRTGPGIAGCDLPQRRVWNGNWSVHWAPDVKSKRLQAFAEQFSLDLNLRSLKPPAIHGTNGVSQKSEGAGKASHYVSLTRLQTQGSIRLNGKDYEVSGLSWMDHEFFTHSLASNESGWDWFSIQFEDNTELMLYRLRRRDGTVEPYSSGTYIDAKGQTRHLRLTDFTLQPGVRMWLSPDTGAKYPIEWTIKVPSLQLSLTTRTRLDQQELIGKLGSSPSYWEGAIEVEGSKKGAGYLEMTGYAGSVNMGQ